MPSGSGLVRATAVRTPVGSVLTGITPMCRAGDGEMPVIRSPQTEDHAGADIPVGSHASRSGNRSFTVRAAGIGPRSITGNLQRLRRQELSPIRVEEVDHGRGGRGGRVEDHDVRRQSAAGSELREEQLVRRSRDVAPNLASRVIGRMDIDVKRAGTQQVQELLEVRSGHSQAIVLLLLQGRFRDSQSEGRRRVRGRRRSDRLYQGHPGECALQLPWHHDRN